MRERVTQRAWGVGGAGAGGTSGSDRSWAYFHDGLGRLTSAVAGTFAGTWASATASAYTGWTHRE